MVVARDTNRLVGNGDLARIAILLALALVIGTYLIATTVLIARDGVFYIEQARKFSSDRLGVIKAHQPGYPFLIFAAHKFAVLFTGPSSVYSWIYSAQGATLLCRLLAIVPLYFVGKLFVGAGKSFWAVLILIMLPYPAKFGSDVVRDWPHILFLAWGFVFLIWGAKQGKWWLFGLAGLAAGLGHMVRLECAQVVVYGILWLSIRLLLPKHNMSRPKLIQALLVLLIGFAVFAEPYVKLSGKSLSLKVKELIDPSSRSPSAKIQNPDIDNTGGIYVGASLPGGAARAFGKLIKEIDDDLFHFFTPALVIGLYFRFRRGSAATDVERFFIPVFIMLNAAMLMLLYSKFRYVSRRHSLPLVAFLVFYVPDGLQMLGDWLGGRVFKGWAIAKKHPQIWFFVVLAVGLIICLPKLVRPMRIDKQGYRDAAKWLEENSGENDLIAVPCLRISHYAARRGLRCYENEKPPGHVDYVVRITADENEKLKFDGDVRKEYSTWVDERIKKKKLVIYGVIH